MDGPQSCIHGLQREAEAVEEEAGVAETVVDGTEETDTEIITIEIKEGTETTTEIEIITEEIIEEEVTEEITEIMLMDTIECLRMVSH